MQGEARFHGSGVPEGDCDPGHPLLSAETIAPFFSTYLATTIRLPGLSENRPFRLFHAWSIPVETLNFFETDARVSPFWTV